MQQYFKRRIALLLLLATFVTLFCGCEKKAPYEKVYEKYMNLALESVQEAQEKYVYFRSDKMKELASATAWELKSYEISEWEQLSDQVWAVTATVHNSYHPEPYQIANFVALIEGEYRVILGILGLPKDLKAGIDYSKYLEMDEDYLGEVRLDAPADLPPQEKVYREYMEYAMEDSKEARRRYVYYKSKENEALADGSPYELYNYTVKKQEQLSDKLWVFYIVDAPTSYSHASTEFFNFVAIIDGKYRVVPGERNLPDELKEGIDFSRFVYENEI